MKVRARIRERGKKKAMARKERGRSQRKTRVNREDAKNTKKLFSLCLRVSVVR
ncbi:MAG: hypothetical protein MZV64_19490 [Ignavibacteriales bacterium]|nr:hypothetical protein [Ignavibacteriales bacterium]